MSQNSLTLKIAGAKASTRAKYAPAMLGCFFGLNFDFLFEPMRPYYKWYEK